MGLPIRKKWSVNVTFLLQSPVILSHRSMKEQLADAVVSEEREV